MQAPEEDGMSDHPNIFPSISYLDANAAIDWLGRAFGFDQHAVYRDESGVVQHAQLQLGAGMIMLGQVREGDWRGGAKPDPSKAAHGIYVVVEDADAHHDRAKAAGAEIVREPTDEDYGGRDYSVRDLEGNMWSFGTYDPYAQH
jgi:uncharacterized glyoxalase superfamily protein PhnB